MKSLYSTNEENSRTHDKFSLAAPFATRQELATLVSAVPQEMIMILEFTGKIWFWKGPSPFYFVTVPEEQSHELQFISSSVTYGWGMIPVTVRLGKTEWRTSLWPKDGGYIVPIKASVRKAEQLKEGDSVTAQLTVE